MPLSLPRSFLFNDTATTEIYTLSLHDALPICSGARGGGRSGGNCGGCPARCRRWRAPGDRKSTRLNSSHVAISYADFCLEKKKGSYERSGRCRDLLVLLRGVRESRDVLPQRHW